MKTHCCDKCLGRAALIGLLAGHMEIAWRGKRCVPSLLSLCDDELVSAVAGKDASAVRQQLRDFDAASERTRARAAGLEPICVHSERFPHQTSVQADGPRALFVAGFPKRFDWLREPSVTVVGSRRPSAYGNAAARRIVSDLADSGVVVISGMALGIDSVAHEVALDRHGRTVAVLGGGADVPYPRSKVGLHRRLVRDGLVVSELPPGVAPRRWCFPARNRIMAAMGTMTVVVEAAARSGSLITADLARDVGREVGAVPGNVTSAMSCGTNDLIADGAMVVRGAADVLRELFGVDAEVPGRSLRAIPSDLVPLFQEVSRGASTVDRLFGRAGDIGNLISDLGRLESLGLVELTPDGQYRAAVEMEGVEDRVATT